MLFSDAGYLFRINAERCRWLSGELITATATLLGQIQHAEWFLRSLKAPDTAVSIGGR